MANVITFSKWGKKKFLLVLKIVPPLSPALRMTAPLPVSYQCLYIGMASKSRFEINVLISDLEILSNMKHDLVIFAQTLYLLLSDLLLRIMLSNKKAPLLKSLAPKLVTALKKFV